MGNGKGIKRKREWTLPKGRIVGSYLVYLSIIFTSMIGLPECRGDYREYGSAYFVVTKSIDYQKKHPFYYPPWADLNTLAGRHFNLLRPPLERFSIVFPGLAKGAKEDTIPFFFALKISLPDGPVFTLHFLSHLFKSSDDYINDLLVLTNQFKYEIQPLPIRTELEKFLPPLTHIDSTSSTNSIEISFSSQRDLYSTFENYLECTPTGNAFFSLYAFVESKLGRRLGKKCSQGNNIILIDQKDWLGYVSAVYQLELNKIPYFIVLKNDLGVVREGRNPNHVKLFSPSPDKAMLTTATVTLDSFSGDDWILTIQGKEIIDRLKRIFLEDLFFGTYRLKELVEGVEVFSTGTPLNPRTKLTMNTNSHLREFDRMILNDLAGAKRYISFFNPNLMSIGRRGYDYSLIDRMIHKLARKEVVINNFHVQDIPIPKQRRSSMSRSKNFNDILVRYEHDSSGTLGPFHGRVIVIDGTTCYLFTGHLTNPFSNELGFRFQSPHYCSLISTHIETLLGTPPSVGKLQSFGLGLMKFFRLAKKYQQSRRFTFEVNGKPLTSLHFESLHPRDTKRSKFSPN